MTHDEYLDKLELKVTEMKTLLRNRDVKNQTWWEALAIAFQKTREFFEMRYEIERAIKEGSPSRFPTLDG